MHKAKNLSALVVTLIFALCLVGTAMAGPGSVEVTVPGDITLKMGAQVRFIPTSEIDRDFGLSDGLNSTQETKAATGMYDLGNYSHSTRAHLTEGAGAVKDNYVRNENRLFFNFAHEQDWDVYMMLEMDTLWDASGVDTTDFAWGRQSQQFGIERLNASFNIPALSSRLRGGWDARGVDIAFGGFTYADDDPGLGLVGEADGWKWEAWWIKKQENEAGYGDDRTYIDPDNPSDYDSDLYDYMTQVNPIGPPSQEKDADRDLYYAKLGYGPGSTYVEAFYMFHRNRVDATGTLREFRGYDSATKTTDFDIDHHVVALQAKGTYGILKPMFEVAHAFGDYETTIDLILDGTSVPTTAYDHDIKSWAAFGDVALDLHEAVGIKKFEPHVGFYYLQGDDDALDDDLEGWAPVTGISRFTPRFGSEQSICHDGNALFGQIEYSMFPAYYGRVRGAGINGNNAYDNPGFTMIGGGLQAAWDNWSYKGNVMAMWFNEESAVEAFYTLDLKVPDVKIDEFMGVEWNNELSYKLYDQVTLKLGVALLFPGDGAEDITQALDAYARDVDFSEGKASDKISQRYAAEILWFF